MNLKQKYRELAASTTRKMMFSKGDASFRLRQLLTQETYEFYYEFKKDQGVIGIKTIKSYNVIDEKLVLIALDYMVESCVDKGVDKLVFEYKDANLFALPNREFVFLELLAAYGFERKGDNFELTVTQSDNTVLPEVLSIERLVKDKEKYNYRLFWEVHNGTLFPFLPKEEGQKILVRYRVIWDGYDAIMGLRRENGSYSLVHIHSYSSDTPCTIPAFPIEHDSAETLEKSLSSYLFRISEEMKFINLLSPQHPLLSRFLSRTFTDLSAKRLSAKSIMELFLDKGYTTQEIETEAHRFQTIYKKDPAKNLAHIKTLPKNANLNHFARTTDRNEIFVFLRHFLVIYVKREAEGKAVSCEVAVLETAEQATQMVKTLEAERKAKINKSPTPPN